MTVTETSRPGPIRTSESLPILWRETADPIAFEKARIDRVFNGRRPNRQPLAVVEARTEDDILEAVQIANKLNVRVSVRSGGHSWAAWSVRDDAILIDLGNYKQLDVDVANRIAIASPSTTGRTLNTYLESKGFMFGGGHCPTVAIGGFLLQGGMGWNCRNWGWACENVMAIDVITADGQKLHCDEKENTEILWMARGAGPGFPAIVTRFYLKIRPCFTNCLHSVFIYKKDRFKEILDWIIKTTEKCDDSSEIVCVGLTPPGMDDIHILANCLTFHNTQEEAEASLRIVNDTRPPGAVVEEINQPTSLQMEYDAQEAANPTGHRYAADNAYISNDADVPAVLEEAFTTLPHKKAFALWFAMNPKSRENLGGRMALSMQSDHYFALYTVWEKEEDDSRCNGWVRDIMKKVERHGVGAYLGDSDFQIRRTRFWGDDEGTKLMKLRQKWDPRGVVCGYLDEGDKSHTKGLENRDEWILADH